MVAVLGVSNARQSRQSMGVARPDRMFALTINFDYDAEPFWEAFWDAIRAKSAPDELRVLEDWEHSLPMDARRLARVLEWCRGLPGWRGVDEAGEVADALGVGSVNECGGCGGSGEGDYGCGC